MPSTKWRCSNEVQNEPRAHQQQTEQQMKEKGRGDRAAWETAEKNEEETSSAQGRSCGN